MSSNISALSEDYAVKLDVQDGEYYLTMFQPSDAARVHAILSVEAVSDRLLRIPKPYTLDMATEWVTRRVADNKHLLSQPTVSARRAALFAPKQGHAVPLQALRTAGGEFIGCASLTHRGEGIVELGYYLDPAHHGHGIMVPAAKAALAWAKEEFGVESVYGSADCTNGRSERVMARVVGETAKGEVKEERKVLRWGVEKVVQGREVESWSRTWEWKV